MFARVRALPAHGVFKRSSGNPEFLRRPLAGREHVTAYRSANGCHIASGLTSAGPSLRVAAASRRATGRRGRLLIDPVRISIAGAARREIVDVSGLVHVVRHIEAAAEG